MSLTIEEVLEGLSIPSGAPVTKTVDGTHPVRAECIARALMDSIDDTDTVRQRMGTFVLLLAGGRCPRCQEILDDISSGSGVTECRCIPVCGDCGLEESTDFRDISEWPLAIEPPKKEGHPAVAMPKKRLRTDPGQAVPETAASEAEEPSQGLWPLSQDGGGGPEVDSVEDARQQVLHYKRMASLRKRSLEAAILRIYELEEVIAELGGTSPPWEPLAMEDDGDQE